MGWARQGRDRATPEWPRAYSDHDVCGPTNGVPLSCAAMIHRYHVGVEIIAQNGRRVWAAQRRPLEWRVGRPALRTLDHADTSAKLVGRAGYGGEARRGVVGYGVWGAARGGRGRSERARSLNRHTFTPTTMLAGHPTDCASAAAKARSTRKRQNRNDLARRRRSDCMRVLGAFVHWLFELY